MDVVAPQAVGSFCGLRLGRACGIKAGGAAIGLMDVTLSDLGPAQSLGSFGCGVFERGALAKRSFQASVVSEMASVHQDEDH